MPPPVAAGPTDGLVDALVAAYAVALCFQLVIAICLYGPLACLLIRVLFCRCCLTPTYCYLEAFLYLLYAVKLLEVNIEIAFYHFAGAALWVYAGVRETEDRKQREKRDEEQHRRREAGQTKADSAEMQSKRRLDVPMTSEAVAERMRNRWSVLEKVEKKRNAKESMAADSEVEPFVL